MSLIPNRETEPLWITTFTLTYLLFHESRTWTSICCLCIEHKGSLVSHKDWMQAEIEKKSINQTDNQTKTQVQGIEPSTFPLTKIFLFVNLWLITPRVYQGTFCLKKRFYAFCSIVHSSSKFMIKSVFVINAQSPKADDDLDEHEPQLLYNVLLSKRPPSGENKNII